MGTKVFQTGKQNGNKMKNLLFLCTGNSCRSQMAEGFCRSLHSDKYECHSAGIEAHGINPYAVKAMLDVGIDISEHKSKTTAELPKIEFDYVITLCSHADGNCPFFPAKTKKIHIGFDDPAKLGEGLPDDEKMAVFARIRDLIRCMIVTLPELID